MEKLKCPYCGSENVTRMDGSDTYKKLGPSVMIDIAPEMVHCNDCQQDFRVELFDDLLIVDENNVDHGEYGPYKQSDREMIYRTVIKELVKRNLAYPCFCSSEDLTNLRAYQEQNKLNPGYYGEFAKCSTLSAAEAIQKIENGEPYVMRFRSSGNYQNKVQITDLIRGNLELAQNDQHIVILK